MQIPSCSSNSHLAPPLLRLRVLPFRIDQPTSIAGISQQLITTAHFPKDTTHSRIHDPGFLAYIPTVHYGSLHSPSFKLQRKHVCQGRQLLPSRKITPKKRIQNTNKWKRRVVCVRIKSTDVNPLGFCVCIISTFDCTTQLYPFIPSYQILNIVQ